MCDDIYYYVINKQMHLCKFRIIFMFKKINEIWFGNIFKKYEMSIRVKNYFNMHV